METKKKNKRLFLNFSLKIKKKGVSLIEIALVLFILAILAIPVSFIIQQNLVNYVFSGQTLRNENIAQILIDDISREVRKAQEITRTDTATSVTLQIRYAATDRNGAKLASTITTLYEFRTDTKIFYKNGNLYPEGLRGEEIQNFDPVLYTAVSPKYAIINIDAGIEPALVSKYRTQVFLINIP